MGPHIRMWHAVAATPAAYDLASMGHGPEKLLKFLAVILGKV
jgi:hypothetical protein